jgi:hypothetical protein
MKHMRKGGLIFVVILISFEINTMRQVDAIGMQDRRCIELASSYLGGDSSYSVESVEVLSGCAKGRDETWFWPVDIDDPRLVNSPISSTDRLRVSKFFGQITTQRDLFLTLLSQMYDSTSPAASAKANLLLAINDFTGSNSSTSTGWGVRPELSESPSVRTMSKIYEENMINFASNPDYFAFTNYVAWWIQRRIATTPLKIQQGLPPIRDAYIYRSIRSYARALALGIATGFYNL